MNTNNLDARAADLSAAWRNAQDLAPMAWETLSDRERAVWRGVASADVKASAPAAPEGEQWSVTVVAGKGPRAKPQMVVTAPNAEMILSGELANELDVQALVDAGLRGFRIE